jgi:hypothetical protein
VLQKKKSDKRQEDGDMYTKYQKNSGAVLDSKNSKESLRDSDPDHDDDSDGGTNKVGSRVRPLEN